jgi:hypothetical protein
MTTYLRNFFTTLFLGITSLALAQSVEKTLVKPFPLETKTVSLDLAGTIEVKTWDSEVLRVQMTITLRNGSEAVLKSLISAGRYNLTAKVANDQTIIMAPGMAREVQVGGKALEDQVTFVIYTPKNAVVKLPSANSTSQNNTGSDSAL